MLGRQTAVVPKHAAAPASPNLAVLLPAHLAAVQQCGASEVHDVMPHAPQPPVTQVSGRAHCAAACSDAARAHQSLSARRWVATPGPVPAALPARSKTQATKLATPMYASAPA
jgi:hypothetical protein